ncbi:hypothetical protein BLA29_010589, partial [Euroglyphus maynei]
RIEELEEELDKERKSKIKAEKQRTDLTREVDELHNRCDELDNQNALSSENVRRLEAEVSKLRRELETSNVNHETESSSLRKRNTDILNETQEQIDQSNRAKSKLVYF